MDPFGPTDFWQRRTVTLHASSCVRGRKCGSHVKGDGMVLQVVADAMLDAVRTALAAQGKVSHEKGQHRYVFGGGQLLLGWSANALLPPPSRA